MLYENEPNEVHLCQNCDAEYTVVKLDNEEVELAFCPYCGEPTEDVDFDDIDEFDAELDD